MPTTDEQEVKARVRSNLLTTPIITAAGTQQYTDQDIQSNELLSNVEMGANTSVADRSINAPTLASVSQGKTTTIADPTKVKAGEYTADTIGTTDAIESAQANGLTDTVQAQTGTASSMTAAQADVRTGFAEAQEGEVNKSAIVKAVTGNAAAIEVAFAELPEDISAAIGTDPAKITAQLMDAPEEMKAAIAAVPEEALVSNQMDSLLKGMDSGKIPAWARPAVSAVEAALAARGMGRSTIGRDALLNTIIQSALPIAQLNAQTIQQTAMANLSNEQQANATNAQMKLQRQLTNVANAQQSEMQSGANSQQMKIMNLQNEQQAAVHSKSTTD